MNHARRYAVVDVETTGLYNKDRITEIAIVTMDRDGEVIDEWDTLVNPQRDVGPTHIHGITAEMVSAAPTFAEVAHAVASRVAGNTLVAHNAVFDRRMISGEFRRLDAQLAATSFCTMTACFSAPSRDHPTPPAPPPTVVEFARERRGRPLGQLENPNDVPRLAHRALSDARICAHAAAGMISAGLQPGPPALIHGLSVSHGSRTLRRETLSAEEIPMPYLASLSSLVSHTGVHGAQLAYMDLLDRALDDLVVTPQEAAQLGELSDMLELTDEDVMQTHQQYFDDLLAAARADNLITPTEQMLLARVAEALNLDVDVEIETWGLEPATGTIDLSPGLRVCFTGSATNRQGLEISRSVLNDMANRAGLQPVKSVTKTNCDLLVAADPSTMSGKAKKARNYDVPIISVHDFIDVRGHGKVRAVRQ